MTIAIMGIAFVAILGGMATSIITSDIHRQEANAQAILRDYAEAVEGSTTWAGCSASPASYAPAAVTFTMLPGYAGVYTPAATGVAFWVSSTATWAPACPGGKDPGLQKISLKVSSARASETLDVVKRCPGISGAGANQCPTS